MRFRSLTGARITSPLIAIEEAKAGRAVDGDHPDLCGWLEEPDRAGEEARDPAPTARWRERSSPPPC
jgi:hypothetical protein